MATATIMIKLLNDDGSVDDWQATYDLDTARSNTEGLLKRIRIIVRREFIRRSLMIPTPEDRTK